MCIFGIENTQRVRRDCCSGVFAADRVGGTAFWSGMWLEKLYSARENILNVFAVRRAMPHVLVLCECLWVFRFLELLDGRLDFGGR